MNPTLRTAAATAALVTGLLAAGGVANAAERTDAQGLSAHLQKAVAAEQQQGGGTTGGPILGLILNPAAAESASS
ncbi:hypothetical protein GCM10010329_57790 [Streptomyces spiroverticillatus]|uniref:Uncharacterized protein n=1 Tax=Streptomyces finlayi TaxID=67296 RepID=A0A918X3G6_9ACTN|nr:hypothetical protein [Streptomyces finlayi]GHA27012.1 hypothetical protein GCM10010329_57790 [Streptomyces spiroverticillatus]GHD08300.1 hypothetical protein GCM10010334_61460 [Streptomyces finlayi]